MAEGCSGNALDSNVAPSRRWPGLRAWYDETLTQRVHDELELHSRFELVMYALRQRSHQGTHPAPAARSDDDSAQRSNQERFLNTLRASSAPCRPVVIGSLSMIRRMNTRL